MAMQSHALSVRVDFPVDLDVLDWSRRHASDDVPDSSPYGLHRLAAHGVQPVFRSRLTQPALKWANGKVRNRAGGLELVSALAARADSRLRDVDAVLSMDERTGIAAALVPGGPPVLSGIAWIDQPQDLTGAYRRVVSRALPRTAGVFTNVEALVPRLVAQWGLAEARVHHVPLGIDAEFFPAQPWPHDRGLVVSAGEDRMRDHTVLVEAVRIARTRVPEAHLEIATSQPLAGGPDLVTVHRKRMNGAMRGLYRRSSVVAVALHPTWLGSGLTVVLEGLASARPVVVTGNPGIDEYVEDGVTGLLVPAGDPGAMAAALCRLLNDPEEAREMGRRGRESVEQRWTSDRMAASLAGIVRTTLAEAELP